MKETLNLHNDINEVVQLGEWIETIGEKYEVPTPDVFKLNLALEEAVVNVMNYAYPGQTGMPVTLTMEKGNGIMTFTLEDSGVPFDPTQSSTPDLTLSADERPIGGLGIFLVQEMMTDVSYKYEDSQNILTMTYSLQQ